MKDTETLPPKRIVIVGGVAGGATAAARARRVDSKAQITILEKGPLVSFANCGLPYHLGGEIAERKKLLVATPELFWSRFRVEVRCGHEVTSIDRAGSTVFGMDHATGTPFQMGYDRLILSTGSEPNSPSFWQEADNVRHLWTMDDLDDLLKVVKGRGVTRATVVGAGFVGLEVAEQLHRLSCQVTLIQQIEQILGPIDRPFARIVENHLKEKGIDLRLKTSVANLNVESGRVQSVELTDGTVLETDLVVVGAGVRPRTKLAVDCGLELGPCGGVRTQ